MNSQIKLLKINISQKESNLQKAENDDPKKVVSSNTKQIGELKATVISNTN